MVVVPKKSGEVRTLKPLNKSVLREIYPIPKVDKTLARGSKFDANSGF